MKETDLYRPIHNFFVDLGYKVNGEVNNYDVTAIKEDEIVIIELKKSLNMKLLIQGAKRQRVTDLVYLAVPRPKKMFSREWKDKVYLTRRLELGLIIVSDKDIKTVQVIHHPRPFSIEQSRRVSKKKKSKLIEEIEGRSGSYNIGGSSKTKIMTAYKEQCLQIACYLSEGGVLSPKQLRLLGASDKTLSILNKNFYGWYLRVERGKYKISDKGLCALSKYEELVKHYKFLYSKHTVSEDNIND